MKLPEPKKLNRKDSDFCRSRRESRKSKGSKKSLMLKLELKLRLKLT
jgi:hypothetical protein